MFEISFAQTLGSWFIRLISIVILQLIGQGSNENILHILYWTSLIAPFSLILNDTFAITSAKKNNLSISKTLIINLIICFVYLFIAELQYQKIDSFNIGIIFEMTFISICIISGLSIAFLAVQLFTTILIEKKINKINAFITGALPVISMQIIFFIVSFCFPSINNYFLASLYVIPPTIQYLYLRRIGYLNNKLVKPKFTKKELIDKDLIFTNILVIFIVFFSSWIYSQLKLDFALNFKSFSNLAFILINILNTLVSLILRIRFLQNKNYIRSLDKFFKSINLNLIYGVFIISFSAIYLHSNTFSLVISIVIFINFSFSLNLLISCYRNYQYKKL